MNKREFIFRAITDESNSGDSILMASLGAISKRDAREVQTANQRNTEEARACEEHKRCYIQGDDA